MIMPVRSAVLAAVCSLAACTAAPHEPPAGDPGTAIATPADPGDTTATIARAVIAPTPAMLAAALSNDPDAMRDAAAATAGTCQAATTCPSQFASCTAWSTPALCNETCGATYCICRPVWQCEGEPPEPRGTQTYNAFRVCFDANRNSCTEWTNTTTSFCGC